MGRWFLLTVSAIVGGLGTLALLNDEESDEDFLNPCDLDSWSSSWHSRLGVGMLSEEDDLDDPMEWQSSKTISSSDSLSLVRSKRAFFLLSPFCGVVLRGSGRRRLPASASSFVMS